MRWLYAALGTYFNSLIRFQPFTGYHNPLVNNHWSRLNSCFLNEHFYYNNKVFFWRVWLRQLLYTYALSFNSVQRCLQLLFVNFVLHVPRSQIDTAMWTLLHVFIIFLKRNYEIHQFIKPRYMHLPHSLIC